MNKQRRAMYYFNAHQNDIVQGHLGEWVAIYDNQILGYYQSCIDGILDETARGFNPQECNITQCIPTGQAMFDVGDIVLAEPQWK
jgi:hypothetical protein